MNLQQINVLKDSYMTQAKKPDGKHGTLGEYMRFLLDGGIDFTTSKDLVVFDDTNELLHCICINDNLQSQANFPVKVMSSEYAMVQQVETIMSQKNFEEFLKSGFISSMISEEKKDFILKWSKTINNRAIEPMDPEPAYNTNPIIIPRTTTVKKREDYVYNAILTVTSKDGTIRNYASIEELLSDLHDGDRISLTKNIDISTSIEISDGKEIFIDMNGNSMKIDSSIAFNITDGSLSIFNNSSDVATISATGEVFRVDATSGTSPKLTIGDFIDVVSESDCCIFAKGAASITSAANLTTSGVYATIQGNGNAESAGTVMNITGCGVRSNNSIAVYWPQDGILNMNDCTVEGSTAIYVKSGTTTLTDCNIVSNGESKDYKYNNNGADPTGDAIVVDFCDYPGSDPKLIVNNCAVVSTNAKALACYDKEGNRDPEISETNVVVDESSTFSDSAVGKVIGKDGEIREYTSVKEALNDLRDGDSLVLFEDAELDESVVIDDGKEVFIDINGKSIKTDNATAFKITDGIVTVSNSGLNGSIESTGEVFRVDATGGTNPRLNIEEGVKIVSDSDCCIFAKGPASIVTAGNLVSNGKYSTIQGNGNTESAGTSIDIVGGSIVNNTADVTIYVPQDGFLNISDAHVRGATPIYIKSGKTTIVNCDIEATGEAKQYKYNPNGADGTGDAIVVDFCDYPGGAPEVTIMDSVVRSTNNKSLGCYDKDGNIDPEIAKEAIKIHDSTFIPDIDSSYIQA